MIYFLFLLNKAYCVILVAGLTYSNMHWRSSPKFVALLQLQNKDTQAPKNTPPPPLCTLFCGKSGEGVFTQSVSCMYPLTPFFKAFNIYSVDNHDDCCGFQAGETAALLNVYYRKSAALANSRGI